ncbi:MAG: DUF3179 domain-containing protein [Opitutaceae bacterium]|nr:DUF3179 domain-containing protein [Opitutaceae bacterium]
MSAGSHPHVDSTSHSIWRVFVRGAILAVFLVRPVGAITINGFAVDDTAVPVEHLVRAAPAKDSISSIDEPNWILASECDYLEEEDELLSVTIDGDTRAYPLRVLVWHEIVNDVFGERPIAITYSALTGSGVAFDAGENADGSPRKFGVSGVLYNSGLLMYDRASESLWSQLKFMGISKDFVEEPLTPVAIRRLTWANWKKTFPDGRVLSSETGFDNDYASEWPYGNYANEKETIFPFDINPDRNEFGTKERMIGMAEGWAARAWPLEKVKAKGQLFDALGARPIQIIYQEDTNEVLITDITNGEQVAAVSVYWFAWQAFYPDSSVWQPLN